MMEFSITRVQTGMVILCLLASMFYGALAYYQCSCYTFYNNITNRAWDISKQECKANGGELVSMETLAEWEFIKTQIQSKTTSSGNDQWWIGLTRADGIWRWMSGSNLTYNKWKPGLELYTGGKMHAIIEKYEGIIWNTYWYLKFGSICEEKRTVCSPKQVKWCDTVTTTSIPTKTTLRDSTTVSSNALQDVPQSTEPTFIGHTTSLTMTTITEQDDKGMTSRKTGGKLPWKIVIIIIIIIVIVLLVIISIIIIICVCRRRRKNKNRRRKNNEEQEKFNLKSHSGNESNEDKPLQDLPQGIYATVDQTEPIYENVQKSNANKPQELNYAVLSDFKKNDSLQQEVERPTTYEPTDYATLNV